jgi:hypothetical protein
MEWSGKKLGKTYRYKLDKSEWNEYCKACVAGKNPREIIDNKQEKLSELNNLTKEDLMSWPVALVLFGVLVVTSIIGVVVYTRVLLKRHLNRMSKEILTQHVHKLVWYSYADLKHARVRITVEDRTDSNPLQGEHYGSP